jgi:hypothetical protein
MEHLDNCLRGKQVRPRRAVVTWRLGVCIDAGETLLSILGRRIDFRVTPPDWYSYLGPNGTAERRGERQRHAAQSG